METTASKELAQIGLNGIDAAKFTGAEDIDGAITAASISGGEFPSAKVEIKALGVDGRSGVVVSVTVGVTVSGVVGGEQSAGRTRGTGSRADVVEIAGCISGLSVFDIVAAGDSEIVIGADMREALAACLAFRS